jgi:hypothetical protein
MGMYSPMAWELRKCGRLTHLWMYCMYTCMYEYRYMHWFIRVLVYTCIQRHTEDNTTFQIHVYMMFLSMYVCMYVWVWPSDSSRSVSVAVQERIRATHSGLAATVIALQPSIRRFVHTYSTYIHTYIHSRILLLHCVVCTALYLLHWSHISLAIVECMYVWVSVCGRVVHVPHGTWPNPGGRGGRTGLQESILEPIQGIPGEIVCVVHTFRPHMQYVYTDHST